MKLLNKDSETVTRNAYHIEHEGGNLYYIEYLDERGIFVDEELRSLSGISIQDDPELLEEIHNFVTAIEKSATS